MKRSDAFKFKYCKTILNIIKIKHISLFLSKYLYTILEIPVMNNAILLLIIQEYF